MSPIRPVTPANSVVWRIIHFPLVLLFIGFVFIMAAGAASHMLSMAAGRMSTLGVAGIGVAIVTAALFLLAYYAFVRLIERRRPVEIGTPGLLPELGSGLIAGLVLFSVVVGVIAAFGGYRIIGTRDASVLWPVLALSITSGVTEEIVFRGLFFRIMESWLGTWIALILSALLFGALHLGNPNATLLAGSAIALEAGVMLAALYMLTRRLWAAIGLHAAWNFAQGGIYGIAVSGFSMDGLLRPRIVGPELLTGGTFGAEASLPAIIVATAFGLVLLYVAWRRDRFVAPFWRRGVR